MSTNKCAFGPCQIIIFLQIKDPTPGIMKTSEHRKSAEKSDKEPMQVPEPYLWFFKIYVPIEFYTTQQQKQRSLLVLHKRYLQRKAPKH